MMGRTFSILGFAMALTSVPALAYVPPQQDRSIRRAATEPLRDARIHEDKIPSILQRAVLAPYTARNTQSCAAIAGEVRQLNSALGVDVDAPGKSGSQGSIDASDAASAAVHAIIPGLGLLRVVTGAQKQERRVQAAYYAGSVRRGYLKGIGLAKNCPAPAAPTKASLAAK